MSSQDRARGHCRPNVQRSVPKRSLEGTRPACRRAANAASQDLDVKQAFIDKPSTPRFDASETSYKALLTRLRSCELDEVARQCQAKLSSQEKKARDARYEVAGVGVSINLAIRNSRDDRARFNEAFYRVFGREPKEAKLTREVFLLVHGEKRKDAAGTDATALAEAVRRRINPLSIPAYIASQGGLEKLIEKERARQDPMQKVYVRISKSMLRRMERLATGEHVSVKILRTGAKISWARYEISRGP